MGRLFTNTTGHGLSGVIPQSEIWVDRVVGVLVWGRAGSPVAVGRLFTNTSYRTVSGTAPRSDVGVDRRSGE